MNLIIRMALFFTLTQTSFGLCEAMIRHYEKIHGIPDKLLSAVSLVESGRTVKGGRLVAWPWTINVNGKGYVFSSKKEAIRAVRTLQAKGIQSIDVGCMQINLKHHPKAFRTLEEAFEPDKNISYAAEFLKQKQDERKSWHMAVAHYHSATPIYHIPYQQKVLKTWAKIKNDKNSENFPLSLDNFTDYMPNSLLENVNSKLQGEIKAIGDKMSMTVQYAPYQGMKIIRPQTNGARILSRVERVRSMGGGVQVLRPAVSRNVLNKQRVPHSLSSSLPSSMPFKNISGTRSLRSPRGAQHTADRIPGGQRMGIIYSSLSKRAPIINMR